MVLATKKEKRKKRHARIRARVGGTALRPRLSVFKSNRTLYAQLIDDEKMKTLAAFSSAGLSGADLPLKQKAFEVGKGIALRAKDKNITQAVFDRGGYRYAGAVKELADGARKGGLTF